MRRTSLLRQAVSLSLVFALVSNSCGDGIAYGLSAVAKIIQDRDWDRQYSARPVPPEPVKDARRDEMARGDLWTERDLAMAERSQVGRGYASIEPAPLPGPSGGYIESGIGSAFPWELEVPMPSGTDAALLVNTNTGNGRTIVPLVSWDGRGGMGVDFTLFHNSKSTRNAEVGYGWSHSYDIYIYVDPQEQDKASVKYSDGKAVVHTLTQDGWVPPAGTYDRLASTGNGGWTLTSKDQSVLTFNSDGFLISEADRNGNVVTITRNTNGWMTGISDPAGRSLTVAYNGNDQISYIYDNTLNRRWTFTYSGNNLASVEYPPHDGVAPGKLQSFTYNAGGMITRRTDRLGRFWDQTYDGSRRVTSARDPFAYANTIAYFSSYCTVTDPSSPSRVQRLDYSAGKLALVTDPAGFYETYTWNASRQLVSLRDRRQFLWTFGWGPKGNLLWRRDPFAKEWAYTYNSTNDMLTSLTPEGQWTGFEYTAAGNLWKVKDRDAAGVVRTIATNVYDGYGQLTSTTNHSSLNQTTSFAYNTNGDLTRVTDPAGRNTDFGYDALSRQTSQTAYPSGGSGNTESVVYDALDRPVQYNHPGGSYETLVYDACDRVIQAIDEAGASDSFLYNAVGNLIRYTNKRGDIEYYHYLPGGECDTVTNGRGKVRTYEYNTRGEVWKLTMPGATSPEVWSYTENGLLDQYTNQLQQAIGYSYNAASLNTLVNYPTGCDTQFAYDWDHRRIRMTDATGVSEVFYNAYGEVSALNTPQGNLGYEYDAASRRKKMTESGLGDTIYNYNSAGELSSLTNRFGETSSFLYDGAGRVTKKTLANGVFTEYGYDNRDRTVSIAHKILGTPPTTISAETYVWSNTGNLTSKTVDGVTTSYGYDALGQLLSETNPGYYRAYTYDANGNRASRKIGVSPSSYITEIYAVDDADRLTSVTWPGDSKTFTYDAVGRTTSIIQPSVGTTTFTYDYESRITSIGLPGGGTNTYAYNGLNARISKTDSTGAFTYKRDGVDVTDHVLSDGIASYTPGVSEWRFGSSSYYQEDYLGTTSKLTDSAAVTTDTRHYDAFGYLVSSTGSTPTPFGFAGGWGYQRDGSAGLQLLGHRYYDASLGRFLTTDPIKSGRNWSVYCRNRASSAIDPDGLDPVTWLYALVTRQVTRDYIKIGITKNPRTRYTTKFLDEIDAQMILLGNGKREDMLSFEREGYKRNGGPRNGERASSFRKHGKLLEGLDDTVEYLRGQGLTFKEVVEGLDPTPIGPGRILGSLLEAIVAPFVSSAQQERRRRADSWLDPGID